MSRPPQHDPVPRTSSTAATALRPRPNRLISGLEEVFPDDTPGGSALDNPLISPYQSRAASPIPSKHPSRSSSTRPAGRDQHSLAPNDLGAAFSGIWGKSWTSLQGIASNVLGSDISNETIKDKPQQRWRRPTEASVPRSDSSALTWGPPISTAQPGSGSLAERQALVRAKKRQELLMANGSPFLDATAGRLKRRTSDEFDSVSTPPGEHSDRDALVYIHHVQPQDTLAGISIKFNCQLAVIKKANRLWSNDNIQARKTVMLPVDSCGVKGRPVPGPEGDKDDLLLGDSSLDRDTRPLAEQAGPSSASGAAAHSPYMNDAQSTISTIKEEPPWQHDSWVQIDSFSSATEIARLPRRELGYFPRTRRKSISLSDLDTPSASFDLAARPTINAPDTSPGLSRHRSRKSSGSNQFLQQLHGPGGVGSLVGKGPSAPGPAEDKLSKVLSRHLPNIILPVSPPPQSNSLDEADARAYYPAGAGSSSTSGLENLGGIIEGWVRKVARNAAKAVEPLPGSSHRSASFASYPTSAAHTRGTGSPARRGSGSGGRGPATKMINTTGAGDLIELTDAFEIGEDDEQESGAVAAEDDLRRGRSLASSSWNGRPGRGKASGFSTFGEAGKKKGE